MLNIVKTHSQVLLPLNLYFREFKKKKKVLLRRRHTPTPTGYKVELPRKQLTGREKILICPLVATTAWIKNTQLKKGTGNASGNILPLLNSI